MVNVWPTTQGSRQPPVHAHRAELDVCHMPGANKDQRSTGPPPRRFLPPTLLPSQRPRRPFPSSRARCPSKTATRENKRHGNGWVGVAICGPPECGRSLNRVKVGCRRRHLHIFYRLILVQFFFLPAASLSGPPPHISVRWMKLTLPYSGMCLKPQPSID